MYGSTEPETLVLYRFLYLITRSILASSSLLWKYLEMSAVTKLFFPNSHNFGVFSHSKGLGAELLSDSLWFSEADPSWAAKRFCGRFHQGFHQGSTKVLPRLPTFRTLSGFLGQIRVELLKGSAEGSTMQGSTGVPLRFHESFSKVAQVS